ARRGLRPLSFGGPRQDLLAGGARASGGDVRRCGGLSGLREAGRSAGASSGSGARRRPEELRHSDGPAILGGGGAFVLSPRGHAPFFLAIFAHSLLPRRADFAFPLTCSPARISLGRLGSTPMDTCWVPSPSSAGRRASSSSRRMGSMAAR